MDDNATEVDEVLAVTVTIALPVVDMSQSTLDRCPFLQLRSSLCSQLSLGQLLQQTFIRMDMDIARGGTTLLEWAHLTLLFGEVHDHTGLERNLYLVATVNGTRLPIKDGGGFDIAVPLRTERVAVDEKVFE